MNIQELQQAIEDYPQKYQRVLSRRTKAEAAVRRLEAELEIERFLSSEEPGEGEATTPQGETYSQLQARFNEKFDEISLAVRRDPEKYGLHVPPSRLSEKAISSVVNEDPEVKKLKEEVQQLKPQRFVPRRFRGGQLLSSKGQEIQERLWEAEMERGEANNETEVCKAELESYKLLAIILTAPLSGSGVTHHD